MKRSIILSFAILLGSVFTFGQNTSTVNQQNGVTLSKVKVEQIGDLNTSTVVQNAGTKNESKVGQLFGNDESLIRQIAGAENKATVTQDKVSNNESGNTYSEILQQNGSGNKILVDQMMKKKGGYISSYASQVNSKNSVVDVYQKAQSSASTVRQKDVVEAKAIVDQVNVGAESTIDQMNGKQNFAKVYQDGGFSVESAIRQDGNRNSAKIDQQVNIRASSKAIQFGNDHKVNVKQQNSSGLVSGSGGSDMGPKSDVYQNGKTQFADVDQIEIENSFSEIDQYVEGNDAVVYQHEGAGLESTIYTNGKFNSVKVNQTGFGGQVSVVTQVGNNNNVNVIQSNPPTP